MSRAIAITLCLSLAATGCAFEFGSVSRSTRISDSSRVAASSVLPSGAEYHELNEHEALAEEIYSKQLDNLNARRGSLRSRRRTLTLATYATFAATTLVIGAAAIRSGSDAMSSPSDGDLKIAGYGALGGLGLGTTLEVVNLMQEDPANIEAKIRALQSSYDNMHDRLNALLESMKTSAVEITPDELKVRAGPIIDAFIDDALQIQVKG